MHSAVFRSLTNNDAQVDIFRDNQRCFKWDTIACTVQKLESTVCRWVNPRGKQKSDDQTPESRGNQLQSSHCFLTIGEEKCVCQWIVDRHHKRQYSNSGEVREFSSFLRKDRTRCDLECSRHWWASFNFIRRIGLPRRLLRGSQWSNSLGSSFDHDAVEAFDPYPAEIPLNVPIMSQILEDQQVLWFNCLGDFSLKSLSLDLLCLLRHFSVGYFKPTAQNSHWYRTNDYHSGWNNYSWIRYSKPGYYSLNSSWLIAFIVNTIFANHHNLIWSMR
jgi:hypothetical protein